MRRSGPRAALRLVGSVSGTGWVMTEELVTRREFGTRPRLLRPRLCGLLDRASAHRLTVLTGPAGRGKSTALEQWRPDCPFALLRLDERDREPERLWRRVSAALTGHSAGSVDGPVALADWLDRVPGRRILALDGFEALGRGPAAHSVADLLGFRPPGLHLVVAARGATVLPLERLRHAGELRELGPSDLAFTHAELAAFTGGCDVDELLARTEGWAAAVALAAESTVDEFESRLHDYVRVEIVEPMPARLLDFLLRLSVVDPVSPDLARALVGRDPQACFEEGVGYGHLRPDAPGWYRFPGPVRSTLLHLAAPRLAEELPALHRAAATWFADHDRPAEALHQAGEANDPRFATDLLVRLAGPLLLEREHAVLADVTARLPIVDALEDPALACALTVGAAARGDGPGAQAYAALVEPNLPGRPPGQAIPLRALTLTALLVAARHDEDLRALADAAPALLDLLAAAVPGLIRAAPALRAAALEGLGTVHLWSGDRPAAKRCLTEAAEHPIAEAAARAGLAMLHYGQGRIREALAEAERSIALAVPEPGPSLARLALTASRALTGGALPRGHDHGGNRLSELAWTAFNARLLARHDLPAARTLLNGLSTADAPRLLRDWIALAEADLHLLEGRPVHALTALGDAGYGADAPLGAATRVMAARAYLASAAPARALSLLAPVPEWTEVGPALRVDAHLVQAQAAAALGHDGAVTIALGAAVAAARPDHLVAPFRAAALAPLLAQHADLLGPGFSSGPVVTISALVEPVTSRERVVLRYLPTLLTLTDIARELSVSPNTVKTHLRHLYRKLAVGNRRDAVRAARRLGLLTGESADEPSPSDR